MTDLLDLPDALRGLMNWMLREGEVSLSQVVMYLGQDEAMARAALCELLEKGCVRGVPMDGEVRYQARMAARRRRTLPSNLWQALDERVEK